MLRHWRPAVALAVTALLLTACATDSNSPDTKKSSATKPASTAQPTTTSKPSTGDGIKAGAKGTLPAITLNMVGAKDTVLKLGVGQVIVLSQPKGSKVPLDAWKITVDPASAATTTPGGKTPKGIDFYPAVHIAQAGSATVTVTGGNESYTFKFTARAYAEGEVWNP